MKFAYPVTLDITGRRCIVIGGGAIAEHKTRALLEAGGRVAVIAPDVTEGIAALEAAARVEVVRRAYRSGDLAGAFVAIAATDDPEINHLVFAEGEHTGTLVNAVDDIDHCHFAAPSIVRRGDLTISIATDGKAPALAKRLRRQLEEGFGPEYGDLVDVLGRVRDETLPARTVDFETWADRWATALDEDPLDLVRAGRAHEAAQMVRSILESGEPPERPRGRGRVALVGAGPGDPTLITVRGRAALDEADVVVYDRLVHPSLLEGKAAIFVGKKAGEQLVGQDDINELLIRLAGSGAKVVRLKGGDPFVFGRGGEEASALRAAGIEFEIVPAPTSAIAALAAAGIPVTDRRAASSVAIVTGHATGGRTTDLGALAGAVDTIVVLMGLAHVREIVASLIAGGCDPGTPAACVENGTLPQQRVVTATLSRLGEAVERAGIGSPAILVVGEVVRLRADIAGIEAGAREPADNTDAIARTA